jgi:hypothetical protein
MLNLLKKLLFINKKLRICKKQKMNLYQVLKSKVSEWRNSKYQCKHQTISEVFDYNFNI